MVGNPEGRVSLDSTQTQYMYLPVLKSPQGRVGTGPGQVLYPGQRAGVAPDRSCPVRLCDLCLGGRGSL